MDFEDHVSNNNKISWEDISDDETLVQQNRDSENDASDGEWKTVLNKKSNKNHKLSSAQEVKNNITPMSTKNDKEQTNIKNPYKLKSTRTKQQSEKNNTTDKRTSLASYMEAAKGKQRTPNSVLIRFTTSFTPRLSGAGEYKRVTKELLSYAKEIAPEVLLMPWDDNSGLGPIHEDDLANPKNFTDTIRHYFDKPAYVTMQPGTPAYGIGIRFSVNCDKFQFYNKWNIRKREYKVNNRAAYTIAMAHQRHILLELQ